MSFNEFIEMGGHGVYVWSCYAMTVTVIGLLIHNARNQRKQLLKQLTDQID